MKKLSEIAARHPKSGNHPVSAELRSWEMSHLPMPGTGEIADLIGILRAWIDNRTWQPSEGSSLEIIWEYAERHGFGGTLGALSLAGRIPPGYLAERGKARYFSNSLHHEKSMVVCRALQKQAMAMAIPFTVIKGPALLEDVYRDSGIRTHSDIDVLVSSRADALRLMRSLNLSEHVGSHRNVFRNRLIQPGRVHTRYLDWEVEFMHPIRWPCDPMFELIDRHRDRLLKVPNSASKLSTPDPELHLLLLIAHMAIHMCFRLIWFLDIVLLVRRYGETIDGEWVEREMDRMQLRNMTACITRFCRWHLDSRFPETISGPKGWNTPIQQAMASVRQIQGAISVYHLSGWRRHFSGFLSPARFFLITDPASWFSLRPSVTRKWLVNRTFYALSLQSMVLHRLLDRLLVFLGLVIPPIFRCYLNRLAPAATNSSAGMSRDGVSEG